MFNYYYYCYFIIIIYIKTSTLSYTSICVREHPWVNWPVNDAGSWKLLEYLCPVPWSTIAITPSKPGVDPVDKYIYIYYIILYIYILYCIYIYRYRYNGSTCFFLFSTLDLSWQRLIFLHESAAWRFQDLPSFRRLQVDVNAAWGKRRDRRRGLIYIYIICIYIYIYSGKNYWKSWIYPWIIHGDYTTDM